jgi:hypothetical protein
LLAMSYVRRLKYNHHQRSRPSPSSVTPSVDGLTDKQKAQQQHGKV